MNVQTIIPRREPIKLRLESFWLLRQSGAFSSYSKSELIEGELWGVPRQAEDEEESDAQFPIKLTIDHYRQIAREGAFEEYRKTELVDGLVYAMSPQYREHGFIKDELGYRLRVALEKIRSLLHVATEQSVAIAPYSGPQPDIALTSEPRGVGPIPIQSVALIVEVSANTIRFDAGEKLGVYASAAVPEYWIVDVERRVLHLFWAPTGDDYAERATIVFGEPIMARSIPDLTIATSGL